MKQIKITIFTLAFMLMFNLCNAQLSLLTTPVKVDIPVERFYEYTLKYYKNSTVSEFNPYIIEYNAVSTGVDLFGRFIIETGSGYSIEEARKNAWLRCRLKGAIIETSWHKYKN